MKPASPPILASGVLVVLVVLILAYSLPRSRMIVLRNHSQGAVENLELRGAGFSETIPRIDAGETLLLRVAPRRGSGLALSFEAAGRLYESPGPTDLDASRGEPVVVDIGPDYEVAIGADADR